MTLPSWAGRPTRSRRRWHKQIGVKLDKPIDVTLMSRVVGQGGFTAGGVYLSYLDGNYTGDDMRILFHHEFVHYYDAVAAESTAPLLRGRAGRLFVRWAFQARTAGGTRRRPC